DFYSRYTFFFSSRRRHTISKRDWSSDVCSSDLASNSIDADRFASAQSNNATSFASPVICMYKKRPVIIRKIAKNITIPIVATILVFLFFFILLHSDSFTLFQHYFILTYHLMQSFIRILHLKSFYVS